MVQSIRELVECVVPFMDVYVPSSRKREQYLGWREELLEHWALTARRRRPCTVDGCGELQRAKSVCRRHYYEQYRR